jgi:multiple sugar transport system permease protein
MDRTLRLAIRPTPGLSDSAVGPRPSCASDALLGWLLLLPAFVLVFVLIAYPLAYEAFLSLTDARVEQPGRLIWLQNYLDLIADRRFWGAAATTLVYAAVATAGKLLLGTAMALSLARPFPGRPIVFVVLLLPWLYPAVLSATALHLILNPIVYNRVILPLELVSHGLSISTESLWPLARIIFIDVWRGTSFVGVFLLVGLNAIPSELFDVAALEGRNSWLVFRLVTLPLLGRALLLAVLLSVGATLSNFSNLYLSTGGREVTETLGSLAYQAAITRGDLGRAAATALSVLPLVVALMLALARLLDREET